MDIMRSESEDIINTDETVLYRYQLDSISTLESGEVAFKIEDNKLHYKFLLKSMDVKLRHDVLSQCHPISSYNIGLFCGLHGIKFIV